MLLVICVLICIWAYVCAALAYPRRKRNPLLLLKSNGLQRHLHELGLKVSVMKYQSVRYALVFGWLVSFWFASWISDISFRNSALVIFMIVTFWVMTGRVGLLIVSRIQMRASQHDSKRDGELIAFARLYELQQRTKKMQLPSFCRHAAEFLPIIRSDLMVFAQRLTTEGDGAYDWLESRLPQHHPFAHKMFAAIRAMENGEKQEFSGFLEKISHDHAARKKKALAPIMNTLMALPSALVIIMILVLLFQFIGITKSLSF